MENPVCDYCGLPLFGGTKAFRVDGTGWYHFECREADEKKYAENNGDSEGIDTE